MKIRNFNPIDLPIQFREYYTKYPHGVTIFESLIEWVNLNNDMVNNINDLNRYMDNFINQWQGEMKEEVEKTMIEWREDGSLDHILGVVFDEEFDNRVNGIVYIVEGLDGALEDKRDILQGAIDNYKYVRIPPGTHYIGVEGLTLKSNTTIEFEPGAVIKLLPHIETHYTVLRVHDIDNVVIKGGVIDGSRELNEATTGEWGHGISIRGGSNITVEDTTIRNCWGDGLYIGRTDNRNLSENIKINNITCDNNRRQGISLISGKNVKITNSSLINTNGTGPQAGIDIEPNGSDEVLTNIYLGNIYTSGNKGAGVKLFLSELDENAVISINIEGHTSYEDTAGFMTSSYKLGGVVNYTDSIINKSLRSGVVVRNHRANGPTVRLNSVEVIDPNEEGLTSQSFGAGVIIYSDTENKVGNLYMKNISVYEKRNDKKMQTTIYADNGENIWLIDPIQITSGVSRLLWWRTTGGIVDSLRRLNKTLTISTTIGSANIGVNYEFVALETKVITLDFPVGVEVNFINLSGYTMRLQPDTGLTILGVETYIASSTKGAVISIKRISETEFVITNKSEGWS